MRAQTIGHKKRLAKRKAERVRRAKAHVLLLRGQSARETSTQTDVSLSTVYCIKRALKNQDKEGLEKVLDPESHFPGRRPILSEAEERLVVSRTLEAAERGFAVNCALMKSVQGKIAQDGRKPFSRGVPSSDAIRSFRARHREITFRTAEQVSSARLAAENTAFKIKLAVAGHRALTPEMARKSFIEAGLWPMNFRFMDRFEPSQTSDNISENRILRSPTRNGSALQTSTTAESRNESRLLLDKIRRLSNSGGSAQKTLAEVQVLTNEGFKVNRLLETDITPPKLAKVSRRSRKSCASKAAAQYLRVQYRKHVSIENEDGVLSSGHNVREGPRAPIVECTPDDNTENDDQSTGRYLGRVRDEFCADVWDDIPIASWRRVTGRKGIGREGSYVLGRTETAVSGLMRLAQLR